MVVSSDRKPQDQAPPAENITAVQATDAQRASVEFTRYVLDVHLTPRDHRISVHATMTLRNAGAEPLPVLPLQLSSSLAWSSTLVGGKVAPFQQVKIRSDADHTGALNEAVVHLPSPLASGAQVVVEAFYAGEITQDATRLTRIGAPADLAAHAEWDTIDPDFIGLRGFGNVVWYPVSSVPVALGDGDRLFSEIGLTKLRQSKATVSITVTDEVYDAGGGAGRAPTVAVLDGTPVPLSIVTRSASADIPTIVKCSLPQTTLGFSTPTLFLAPRTAAAGNELRLYARPENLAATQSYMTASSMVTPLLHQWLGAHPRSELTIVDLPDKEDAPFEDGQVLLTGLRNTEPARLTGAVTHALAHAYFASPRPWLDYGVPEFMAGLRTEQVSGREAALSDLDKLRPALALAEPADPATADAGQPLVRAHDAIYYRTKAAYVLWMLRTLTGDTALAGSLRAYDPSRDTADDYFEHLIETTSGKKLDWFFNDWVYRDRGLPDLSIASVFPTPASTAGSYLVAVNVTNDGAAAAEVPVTVTSADATATERLLVPARGSAVRRILIQGRPEEVQVNDGTVPEVQASVHRTTIQQVP